MIKELSTIIASLENPSADINATIPTYFGYKLAKKNHIKTIFTGDGADLAFWGNPPMQLHPEPTAKTRIYNILPQKIRLYLFNLVKSLNKVRGANNQELIRKLDPHNPLPYYLFFNEEELTHLTPLNFDIYGELQSCIHRNYYLNIWDQVRLQLKIAETMSWGVQRLVDYSTHFNIDFEMPVEDYRVKELAASIPPELKQCTGVDKYILRQAIHKHGLLPDDVINQKKEAFGQSLRDVIVPHIFNRDMENYMHNILLEVSPEIKQYMDQGFIENCIRKGTLNQKFALLIFSNWYQVHMF